MKVELIDSMGDDVSVVNAARASFDRTTDVLREKDVRLLNYLATHGHWTPFAHPQIQVRICAPFFIARQWFKHCVGAVRNEVSRRYVDGPWEFWLPEVVRGRPENAKQGSSGPLPDDVQETALQMMRSVYVVAEKSYDHMIRMGVAPEQARAVIPMGAYTTWVETMSLATAARICRQRIDDHAQEEVGELAEQLHALADSLFPHSMAALME